MRYIVSMGEDETGPILADKDGEYLIFHDHGLACDAAKRLVREGHIPFNLNTYVFKLVPTAMYMPVAKTADGVFVDETLIGEAKPDEPSNN
jgi:hypothetical protein